VSRAESHARNLPVDIKLSASMHGSNTDTSAPTQRFGGSGDAKKSKHGGSSASQGCGIVNVGLGIFFIVWASIHGEAGCGEQKSYLLAAGIVQVVTGVVQTAVGCINCAATCCIDPLCSDYDVSGEKTMKPGWKCTKMLWNVATGLFSCGLSVFGLAWLIYGIVLFLPTGYDGGFEGGCAELHKLGFVWTIIGLCIIGFVLLCLPVIIIAIVLVTCGAVAMAAAAAVDEAVDSNGDVTVSTTPDANDTPSIPVAHAVANPTASSGSVAIAAKPELSTA
jgi:hypothetical protein